MTKTKWIASLDGLMIPGEVVGESGVVTVDPGEAVEVPRPYATSLIDDGLAYEADSPDTDPPTGDGDDPYSKMTKAELEAIAEEFGYNPPGNIKKTTLLEKVQTLVAEKFDELEAEALKLGIDVQEDWAIEELEAAIEAAK